MMREVRRETMVEELILDAFWMASGWLPYRRGFTIKIKHVQQQQQQQQSLLSASHNSASCPQMFWDVNQPVEWWFFKYIYCMSHLQSGGHILFICKRKNGKTSGQCHDSIPPGVRVAAPPPAYGASPLSLRWAAALRKRQRKLKTEVQARAPSQSRQLERETGSGAWAASLIQNDFLYVAKLTNCIAAKPAELRSAGFPCGVMPGPLASRPKATGHMWRLNLSGWEQARCTSCQRALHVLTLACLQKLFFSEVNLQTSIPFAHAFLWFMHDLFWCFVFLETCIRQKVAQWFALLPQSEKVAGSIPIHCWVCMFSAVFPWVLRLPPHCPKTRTWADLGTVNQQCVNGCLRLQHTPTPGGHYTVSNSNKYYSLIFFWSAI